MPKSRQRKNHKKKVAIRNAKIKNEFKRASKEAWDKFDQIKKDKESQ